MTIKEMVNFVYGDTDEIYVTKKGKDDMKMKMKTAKFKVGDMVRILDGSKLTDFRCGYVSDMKNRIGEVHKISKVVRPFDSDEYPGYRFDNMDYTWDERSLEKVDELYVVSVSGRNVFVLGNGKMGKARCNPEDKFDLAKGISLALERMDKIDADVIKEGDWVEVVNPGYVYSTYSGWVSENIKDKTMIAEYRYGESVPKYSKGKVIKIAKHHTFDDTLAFIKGHNGYYLISLEGLKKVRR